MALREFILEQLYVVQKSVKDLKNQQQAPEKLPLFEYTKEEIVYLRAENKKKTKIIKVILENQSYKNIEIPRMINDSFDPENKTQIQGNVSTKHNSQHINKKYLHLAGNTSLDSNHKFSKVRLLFDKLNE